MISSNKKTYRENWLTLPVFLGTPKRSLVGKGNSTKNGIYVYLNSCCETFCVSFWSFGTFNVNCLYGHGFKSWVNQCLWAFPEKCLRRAVILKFLLLWQCWSYLLLKTVLLKACHTFQVTAQTLKKINVNSLVIHILSSSCFFFN